MRLCAAAAVAVAICVATGTAGTARAQPPALSAGSRGDSLAAATPAPEKPFGPLIVIEAIRITGNTATADRVIRRALPFRVGDSLRAGDPRLRRARFKVLALGFFRKVDLSLSRGSARGKVVLTVHVVERGTVVLNRLYLGTTSDTPWWAGLDLTERNFVGTGLAVGGGFVYAGQGRASGARAQWSLSLRAADPSIRGGIFGLHGAFRAVHASEPYRISGAAGDGNLANFLAFPYSRVGGSAGIDVTVTPLSRLSASARFEQVQAQPPATPVRDLPGGGSVPVDLHIRSGTSHVATVSLGFDRDTRPDPILPYIGNRVVAFAEAGGAAIGGSYDFGKVLARYEQWWPIAGRRHVLSLHLTGGFVFGDPPRFERLHDGDFNRILTPRAAGLVVATAPAQNLLGGDVSESGYGDIGGSAELEYSYALFRGGRIIYGGNLFAGAGVWGLVDTRARSLRGRSVLDPLPVDLLFDFGLRLDTEIGIFELTLDNALGRVP